MDRFTTQEEEVRKMIAEATNDIMRKLTNVARKQELNEMARVGFLDNKAKYEVYVRTNDAGFIPHVHIWDSATCGEEFDCCVKLETNEYFFHGHHTDRMNSKMCKAFAEFMEQPCRSPKYKNNYELAVEMWNLNNSDTYDQIKEDSNGNIIMPNYRNIN